MTGTDGISDDAVSSHRSVTGVDASLGESSRRVLVTGASGVFGREITARLVRAGDHVVTLSRRRPTGLPPGVRHVAADIRDADAVASAADGCDVVAHCAWVVDATAGQEDEARSVNLDGT